MNKVKVVVIGYGHLGKWHTQKAAGLESSELVGIVESFEPNQKAAKENHPGVEIYNDYKDTLELADAYVVVTPTSTHFELTKELLKAGKHVFCEKPLCETYEQVIELGKYLSTDQVLQVGHSERCHQAWEILNEDFKSFTAPVSMRIERVAEFKGRATDVDVVQDLMIHDIDLALFLLNKKPKTVKAWGHKIRTPKWDQVTALITFEDKSEALITSGRNHVHEVRSLEITHDNGCFYVDLFRNEIHNATSSIFPDGAFVKKISYEKRDHLNIEQSAFYNSILNKTPPMVDYNDGKAAIYIIEAVIKSLDSGESIEV